MTLPWPYYPFHPHARKFLFYNIIAMTITSYKYFYTVAVAFFILAVSSLCASPTYAATAAHQTYGRKKVVSSTSSKPFLWTAMEMEKSATLSTSSPTQINQTQSSSNQDTVIPASSGIVSNQDIGKQSSQMTPTAQLLQMPDPIPSSSINSANQNSENPDPSLSTSQSPSQKDVSQNNISHNGTKKKSTTNKTTTQTLAFNILVPPIAQIEQKSPPSIIPAILSVPMLSLWEPFTQTQAYTFVQLSPKTTFLLNTGALILFFLGLLSLIPKHNTIQAVSTRKSAQVQNLIATD
jgi:hypothetical protein